MYGSLFLTPRNCKMHDPDYRIFCFSKQRFREPAPSFLWWLCWRQHSVSTGPGTFLHSHHLEGERDPRTSRGRFSWAGRGSAEHCFCSLSSGENPRSVVTLKYRVGWKYSQLCASEEKEIGLMNSKQPLPQW